MNISKLSRSIAFGLLLIATFCSVARAQSGPSGPWNLTFSDEFNGTSLDTTKWGAQYTWSCTNNDELEGYQAANVTEGGGLLTLTAKNQSVTCSGATHPYTSGMIESSGKFSQLYGYYEARMQVPAYQGFWPAFWLLPESGAWPPEIDTLELGQSGDFTTARMTNHFGVSGSGSYDSQTWSNPGTAFGSALHTFGVNWEPGSLTFYIDGTLRATINAPSCPATGSVGGSGPECISSVPMYVLANLAVGGSYTGGVLGSTPFPSSMVVDYIRVYQQAAGGCYASIPSPTTIPSTTCSASATPNSPTNLAATVNTLTPAANLTWTPSTSTVVSQTVSRGTASGGPYTQISGALATTAATYQDALVVAGKTYYYVVEATNASGTVSANSNQAVAAFPATTGTAPPATTSVFARFGNTSSYTDPSGNVWQPATCPGSTYNNSHAVTGTTTQALYQSECYGKTFSIKVAGLTAGASYSLRLLLDESYWTSAGGRVFSVTANTAPWITNLDIFKEVGEFAADDKTTTVTADATGAVTLAFTSSADNATLNALSLIPTGVAPPPPPATLTISCTTWPTCTLTQSSIPVNTIGTVSVTIDGITASATVVAP